MENINKFFEEEIFVEGSPEEIAAIKNKISAIPNIVYSCQKQIDETEVLFFYSWNKDVPSNWTDFAQKNSCKAAVFENIVVTDLEKRQLDFWCNDSCHRYFDFESETIFAGKMFNLTKVIPASEFNTKVSLKKSDKVRAFADEVRNSAPYHEASQKIEHKLEELLGKKMFEALLLGK